MISEYFSKVIIYKGVAGIGKSHTLANFINEYYIKQNKPALLILGQDFYSSKNIENQLIDITQGTADFNVNESINFVKNNFSSWSKVADAEYNVYKNILENKNG